MDQTTLTLSQQQRQPHAHMHPPPAATQIFVNFVVPAVCISLLVAVVARQGCHIQPYTDTTIQQ